MDRFIRAVEGFARAATGIAFVVMMIAVLIQLAGRGGVISAPVWTEEAARFCLLFIAAFGAGLALRSGDLVNVDLVCEALPKKWPWRLRLISAAITAGTCALLLLPAWAYTTIGSRQTAPALGVRMDLIHASVLILLAGLGLFALLRVIAMVKGTEDGLAIKPAEEM